MSVVQIIGIVVLFVTVVVQRADLRVRCGAGGDNFAPGEFLTLVYHDGSLGGKEKYRGELMNRELMRCQVYEGIDVVNDLVFPCVSQPQADKIAQRIVVVRLKVVDRMLLL